VAKLSPKSIRAAPTGRWLPDDARRGTGVLILYVTGPGKGIWYFRYTTSTGRRDTLPLLYPHGACEYHEAGDGEATYSLKQARDLADKHRAVYLAGNRDLRGYYDQQIAQGAAAEQAALEAQRQAEAEAALAAARRDKHSLKALLAVYVGHLERRGKPAARDARNIFRRHVEDAFPALAARPATEITAADLRSVLARLVEAGKGRTAGKLRSYLSAAFQLALRAENDPAAPTGLSDFEIVANPCDRIPSLSEFNRTRDRALSWPELIAYRKAVEALPKGATRDCLLAPYCSVVNALRSWPALPEKTSISLTARVRRRSRSATRKAPGNSLACTSFPSRAARWRCSSGASLRWMAPGRPLRARRLSRRHGKGSPNPLISRSAPAGCCSAMTTDQAYASRPCRPPLQNSQRPSWPAKTSLPRSG